MPDCSTVDPPPGSGNFAFRIARTKGFFKADKSKFADNISQANFQSSRNPQKNIHRRHSKAALNLPHINRIDVNPFSQLFLGESGELAVFADAAAQQLAIFLCNHALSISQARRGEIAQILIAIIFYLHFGWQAFRKARVNGSTVKKIRILIVEDDMPIAMMMVFLLARADCEAKVATTGKKAMQLAEEGDFDLITLNVDLPDGNGFKLCSRLKEHPRLCDTPVIFVSARSSLEDQQHGLDVGAADYITKPFETFEFATRLLSHVRQTNEVLC
jgi:CheY-like chemotaxis protein